MGVEQLSARGWPWAEAEAGRHHLLVFAVLLCLSFLPFLILGQDAHVIMDDNLDAEIPWRVVLAREGLMFAGEGKIGQVMNGLPRSCLPSGLNLTSVLFALFPPFTAYLITHLLVHAVAFVGMYLLLSRHVTPGGGFINSGVAFCFALLPFYVTYGLSIAGQPLLLAAVLAFARRRARLWDLAIVALFPLGSYFVLVGIFILAALGIWFLLDLVRTRRPNPGLLLCIVLLTAGYVLIEQRLLRDVLLGGDYVSHRVEYAAYAREKSYGILSVARRTLRNFADGQYHVASLHQWILLAAVPVALAVARARKEARRSLQILGLLAICALFSFLLAVQGWSAMVLLKEKVPLLSLWQFGRFHWLHPLLWFVLFALALDTIRSSRLGDLGTGRRLAAVLLAVQCAFVVSRNEELAGSGDRLLRRALGSADGRISWAGFYSEALFQKIDRHIGRPKRDYRIVNLGLHPGIAAYNGFYTLDFYSSNYPLSYKKEFRRMIARELEKNARWRRYFDGWGNRCYALASELPGYSIPKSESRPIRNLEFGTDAFRRMGGRYVFSAVEIKNHSDNGLVFEGSFEDEGSPWRIWLYRAAS